MDIRHGAASHPAEHSPRVIAHRYIYPFIHRLHWRVQYNPSGHKKSLLLHPPHLPLPAKKNVSNRLPRLKQSMRTNTLTQAQVRNRINPEEQDPRYPNLPTGHPRTPNTCKLTHPHNSPIKQTEHPCVRTPQTGTKSFAWIFQTPSITIKFGRWPWSFSPFSRNKAIKTRSFHKLMRRKPPLWIRSYSFRSSSSSSVPPSVWTANEDQKICIHSILT